MGKESETKSTTTPNPTNNTDTTTTTSNTKGKESSNNHEKEKRTIFVGNLPLNTTTRKTLRKLFQHCGKIESTRIRSQAIHGVKLPPEKAGNQNLVKKICANNKELIYSKKLNCVNGYVVFEDVESIPNALKMNNTVVLDGSSSSAANNDNKKYIIRVDTAIPTIDNDLSIFIGNLPYNTQENTLRSFFEQALVTSSSSNNNNANNNNKSIQNVRIV